MNRALYAAASGMAAQQQNLETIAENLSNADVSGFKAAERTFSDIAAPTGGTLGTIAGAPHTIFTQGKLVRSGGPFDVAIRGEGFFVLRDDRGGRAYTRDGEFARAADGTLQNAQGWQLEGVRIPSDALSVRVAADGSVRAQRPRGSSSCGRIRLARFTAPEALESSGGTLFFATHASGKAHAIVGGAAHGPQIFFGMLERSNVSIVEAMMQILAAQRAYEANAKGVQAADEMQRIADNLSRG